jgi:O-antigen ligase
MAAAGAVLPASAALPPREPSRWTAAARAFFLLAAFGSVSSPPAANIFAFLALLAYAGTPQAWPRLQAAARRPLGLGLLVLLATLAAAMLWAEGVPWGQRFASWWSWRPLVLLLVGSALYDEAPARDRFAFAMVVLLALGAIGSFVLNAFPGLMALEERGILLRNHVTQGMGFVVGILLAALLVLPRAAGPASGSASGSTLGPAMRRLCIGSILLFLLNLGTITSGRSPYVALLVAAMVVAAGLLPGRTRWIALLWVPVLGAALLAASPLVRERFGAVYSEAGTVDTSPVATSSGIRIVIWKTTRELIARHPLLGVGMGGYPAAYAGLVAERVPGDADWRTALVVKDTHNEYLHVMVEAGVPGLLAFFLFVAGALRQRAPPPYRVFGWALLGAWLATSLFNSHFQTFAEAHLLGLVLGVLLAAAPQDDLASSASASAATES